MANQQIQAQQSDYKVLAELIEEISYCNVQLADWENSIVHDPLTTDQHAELKSSIQHQKERIAFLKKDLAGKLMDILSAEDSAVVMSDNQEVLIPNYNTLSTLLDRVAIENVKLFHFEQNLEKGDLSVKESRKYEGIIELQHKILRALCQELTNFFKKTCALGNYKYLKEERTFR